MAKLKDNQVTNSITRDELITNQAGKSVIAKVLAGTGISTTWTGTDVGTGDVTVNLSTTANADTVDGYHLNQDVRTTASPAFAGNTINGKLKVAQPTAAAGGILNVQASTNNWVDGIVTGTATTHQWSMITGGSGQLLFGHTADASAFANKLMIGADGIITTAGNLNLGANTIVTSNSTVITNLNADKLDGQDGSYYSNYNNLSNKPIGVTVDLQVFDNIMGQNVYLTFVNGILSSCSL